MQSLNNRIRIALTLLATGSIVTFSLLLFFNETIRSFVLEPILESVNAVRFMLGYVSQDLQWTVALLIVIAIIVPYFMFRVPKHSRQKSVPQPANFPTEGPAMKLTQLVERSAHSRFLRGQVILELRDLAARSVAYHHGMSVEQAKQALDTMKWTSDPSVRAFLSSDNIRARKQKQKGFRDQAISALTHIERIYQEV